MNWVVIASLGAILSLATIPVFAAETNKFISITRSKACEMTDCIKVGDLIPYDTSNQKISGEFYFDPRHNDYDRKKGMPNHANWYYAQSKKSDIIFVEPDNSVLLRSKNIEIVSSLKEFAPQGNLTKTIHSFGKAKTVTYTGVYVSPKCDFAKVGIKQYPNLTKIIEHLQSNCSTKLDNIKTNIFNQTKLNYCGQECQHQKFVAEAKIKAKSKLIIAGKS